MADWSVNNRACATTWTTLRLLGQIKKTLSFEKSGVVKMNELKFWNEATSSDMREIQARALAVQMDNIFCMVRGAVYESDVANKRALTDTAETLLTKDKSIADLAEINDANYRFWQEDQGA